MSLSTTCVSYFYTGIKPILNILEQKRNVEIMEEDMILIPHW